MGNDQQRTVWIDYLRSAITVLVVAHHSSLAYTTFASFDSAAYINSTHPIVDSHRWVGLDIFENFNDVFFMSLMFFIGGLFLLKSIQKKGIAAFIKDRIYRLFLPFILGGTFLMLLAYFPSYYVAHGIADARAYINDFFTVEKWPVGPPWFIWVLFSFNLLFAISYPLLGRFYSFLGQKIQRLGDRPLTCFLLLEAVTWLLYVPIAYRIGAGTWTGFGPFDFQLSRVLLYNGYFLMGVLAGYSGFNQSIFSPASSLVRKWLLWAVLALTIYALLTINGRFDLLQQCVEQGKMTAFAAWMVYYTLYVSSCSLSCLAFITAFRRHAWQPKARWASLSENAYLIYLIHYVFVIWLQYLILSVEISAIFKFVLVFVLSLLFSWVISIQLR